MTSLSYGQYTPGTYNEFGPNTNANSANHAATTIYGHSVANNATGGSRLAIFGTFAGENNTIGNHNSFFGFAAGRYNTGGSHNNFFGDAAGHNNTTGGQNSAFGNSALAGLTTGVGNVAVGYHAGRDLVTGEQNVAIGVGAFGSTYQAGTNPAISAMDKSIAIGPHAGSNPSGSGGSVIMIGNSVGANYAGGDYSILIGTYAGYSMQGSHNIAIGSNAGKYNVGTRNIFIGGNMNPANETTNYDNHLFIGNDYNTEFIVGDIVNGKLGINTLTPQNALDVCGKIRSNEMICEAPGWCDYVFYEDYDLPDLREEAQHIEEKGHLIGFQSEEEMDGEIHVADVTKRQQVKIEEIMLHLIQMEKENTEIREHLKQLESENTELKTEIKILKKS